MQTPVKKPDKPFDARSTQMYGSQPPPQQQPPSLPIPIHTADIMPISEGQPEQRERLLPEIATRADIDSVPPRPIPPRPSPRAPAFVTAAMDLPSKRRLRWVGLVAVVILGGGAASLTLVRVPREIERPAVFSPLEGHSPRTPHKLGLEISVPMSDRDVVAVGTPVEFRPSKGTMSYRGKIIGVASLPDRESALVQAVLVDRGTPPKPGTEGHLFIDGGDESLLSRLKRSF
jgi:hypothetical protein